MNIDINDYIITEISQNKHIYVAPRGIQIYHKPTEITVMVDRFKSQHKNKNEALMMINDLVKNHKTKYKLELIRFKLSGAFYDHISFETSQKFTYKIIDEIKTAIRNYELSDDFNYMITGQQYSVNLYQGKDHPNGFPHFFNSSQILRN